MFRLAVGVLVLVSASILASQAQAPAPGGTTLASLDRDIRAGLYGNTDALVAVQGDRVIANHTYRQDYGAISRGRRNAIGCGSDCTDTTWLHHYNYFHPRWHPYFEGRQVHSLQSVTKSVSALVVGIALDRGAITSLSEPFLNYVQHQDLSRLDPRLRTATVEDVLTMRTGIEWHEQDRPLDDTNTTVQLEKSRDWIAFTLSQPMDAAPRTKWAYNSGGSMLMSAIVRSATGRHIDDYAREVLFGPLGITDVHWKRTPTGHPDTEGGLYLSAMDLATIGMMVRDDGRRQGRQVVSASFLKSALTRHVTGLPGGFDYGYQWWITRRGEHDVWAGRGFGGQFLVIIPSLQMVGVANAWNVFPFDASRDVRPRNLQNALIDALIDAATRPRPADVQAPQ